MDQQHSLFSYHTVTHKDTQYKRQRYIPRAPTYFCLRKLATEQFIRIYATIENNNSAGN